MTSKPHATLATVAGANAVTVRTGLSVIALRDRRDEIVAERGREIEPRREPPVAPRGRIIHVLRPRIDDVLTLLIDGVCNGGSGERTPNDLLDLEGRRVERRQVVGRLRQ